MKILEIICNYIFKIRRENWIKRLQARLVNKNFTLITNNCCAGIIYSDLGLKFTSPTINLYFLPEDYLLFCKNLKLYVDGTMENVSAPDIAPFPVGKLNPANKSLRAIRVFFMHYKTYEEAYCSWKRRCKRIRYDNIFYLWELNNANTDFLLIQEFDRLPLKKIILSYKDLPGINNYYQFHFSDSFVPGKILEILSNGKRNIDEFDYVNFLNS